jgi:hypothetical protein
MLIIFAAMPIQLRVENLAWFGFWLSPPLAPGIFNLGDAIASLAPEKAINSLDFVFDRNLKFNMNDRSRPGLMHEPWVLGTARSMNFVWSMIYAAIYPSANLPATLHFLPSVIS